MGDFLGKKIAMSFLDVFSITTWGAQLHRGQLSGGSTMG
jgi:hypothetical protein